MKRAELDTYPVAYVDGLLARVAELESEAKQAREDEAWAKQMHVGCIAREEDEWVASAWNVKMQSVDQANATTIAAAIRSLREKVEGGCAMTETYGTFSTAYVEAMRLRLSALEPENKDLRARVAELEARCKRLEEAGDRLAAFTPSSSDRFGAWSKAKEAKP